MGLPISIGTVVTGSLAVDAASYVWAEWAAVSNQVQPAETWRLQNLVNTACYWTWCLADTTTGTNVIASGALNETVNQTANGLYTFPMETRRTMAAGSTLYYNFRPSATTTVRVFWVTASRSENSVI